MLPSDEIAALVKAQRPGPIPTEALEWCLATLCVLIGLFMLMFQPGWRPPLEQLMLPGLHIHLPGLAWPIMVISSGCFQAFALHRRSQRLRRIASGTSAFMALVMALSFAQANYFVVGVPSFMGFAVWQAFVFTILRDTR